MDDSQQTLLARIGAIVFVAIAITALVLGFVDREQTPNLASKAAPAPVVDPLRATLRHCQRLGEAAVREPECVEAWATSRDRFLGRPPASGR